METVRVFLVFPTLLLYFGLLFVKKNKEKRHNDGLKLYLPTFKTW